MIFLGIDCGTQSTKTIALDWESGEILASAQKAYGFVPNLPAGAMEQDPKDWIEAGEQSIGEVMAKLGALKDEVCGIGVSGQQHGLVVLDQEDRVVRPAKLWNDTTTSSQCDQITDHFGGPAGVVALVGNTMRTGYTAPKILWLRQNEPENWKRTRSILLPHDYLNFWLTGAKKMEFGDASGTALLDVKTRQWSMKLVDYIADDLSEKLPLLISSKLPNGTLREELCRKWGLTKAPSVSAGGGDNMMAAIGTGNIQPGVVTASLAQLEEQIGAVPAGCDGLLLLPYLTGERTPDLPNSTGVFHGLTLTNFTAPHMARAAFEGVTLGLGYGLARFRELGMHPAEIRLTGGGSNSRLWRQMCADVFGVPTVCLQSGEGAGLGGAIQAGWVWNNEQGSGATLAEICERLVQADETSRNEPDANASEVYSDALNRTSEIRKAFSEAKLI
jgi:xylulokinase